jgi:hypothetical protein
VSCKDTSTPALAKVIPVNPPKVNKIKNPNINKEDELIYNLPDHKVANQLKILIPVGTAITIVEAVK